LKKPRRSAARTVKREKKAAVNPHKEIIDKIAAELSREFKSDTDALCER